MNQQAQDVATVTVWLPLPPKSLGKGASTNWWEVRRDYETCKTVAYHLLCERMAEAGIIVGEHAPWLGALMHVEWTPSSGRAPDDDNAVIRCAAYRDAAEAVGLVTDDKYIRIGRVAFAAASRSKSGVVITFERMETHP